MTNTYPLLAKYLKTQACLAQPLGLCDKPADLERTLKARTMIRLGSAESHMPQYSNTHMPNFPQIQVPSSMGDYVYFALQVRGCQRDYPTPELMDSIREELRRAFTKAGIDKNLIDCSWRGDKWRDEQLERFDETVYPGAGDHQIPRLDAQKFQRTQGEVLLTYQVPAKNIGQLATLMQHIQESVQQAQRNDFTRPRSSARN